MRGQWACHLVFRRGGGAPQGFMRLGRDGALTQLRRGVEPGARLAVGFFAWGKRQVRLDDFADALLEADRSLALSTLSVDVSSLDLESDGPSRS